MDIREVRRERLLLLLAEEGGKRNKLASRIKKSPSQLSQWLGHHRTITEDSAREIERNAGKPAWWLDGRDTVAADHIVPRSACGSTDNLVVEPAAGSPELPAAGPAPPLLAALPVVLKHLPGLDDYTAGQVLQAIQAATRPNAPLKRIEADLMRWLTEGRGEPTVIASKQPFAA